MEGGTAYLRQLLPRLARKAGLPGPSEGGQRWHCHGLRHSGAVAIARGERSEDGVPPPLHVVQNILGHSSLATTSVYLRHVGLDDVRRAMGGGS